MPSSLVIVKVCFPWKLEQRIQSQNARLSTQSLPLTQFSVDVFMTLNHMAMMFLFLQANDALADNMGCCVHPQRSYLEGVTMLVALPQHKIKVDHQGKTQAGFVA